MKTEFTHSGKYTAQAFTIEEVVGSLSAQKALLEAGVSLLAELDQNFRLEKVTIRVESLATGSLFWDLLIEIYGEYQADIEDRVIGEIENMFGMDVPSEYEGLVTLGALAVTYVVARYAYDRVARSKGEKSGAAPNIVGNNNVVIQQIANASGHDEQLVERALDRTLPPSKRQALIPKVADFLRPAKKDPSSSIELKGAPNIMPETLSEFPSDADLKNVDDTTNVPLEGQTIDIRGTDRDKNNTGWGAVIVDNEQFPKRLPMDLYPTVDRERLAQYRIVKADLIVECDRRPDGCLRPKRIHLLSFEPPEDS